MKIAGLDLSINSSGLIKFTLDDDLNVVDTDHRGFTSVKKDGTDKILHYQKKDFPTNIHQNEWTLVRVMEFIDDVDYVAIEDYAFGATGRVFNIAEWCGAVKFHAFLKKKKIRLIDPNSVKMFATTRGNCDKISMSNAYDALEDSYKLDFSTYKEVTKSSGVSPTSDLIDAFYLTKILLYELRLRRGLMKLSELKENEIRVFNRCTKANPVNMLDREFIVKEV